MYRCETAKKGNIFRLIYFFSPNFHHFSQSFPTSYFSTALYITCKLPTCSGQVVADRGWQRPFPPADRNNVISTFLLSKIRLSFADQLPDSPGTCLPLHPFHLCVGDRNRLTVLSADAASHPTNFHAFPSPALSSAARAVPERVRINVDGNSFT